LRGVSGDIRLASEVEAETRRILFDRARHYGAPRLRDESMRVRELLEKQRAGRSRREIDIKYGAGGMLDVYFAMRYLQLIHGVTDSGGERSTGAMLDKLYGGGFLDQATYASFSEGYRFLSSLDHQLRLTIGRSTKFPAANREALEVIAHRIGIGSADALAAELTTHRLEIRSAYDDVFRHKI
jgi:glutamate-ammonia-ligase adenylyltransferase